jgi:hypothetical protein
MLVKIHCLRERGRPIPKHQIAFKPALAGWLTVHEERDSLLNRHTRVARFRAIENSNELLPALRDAQLVELTRERLILSGIERCEDATIDRVEDFAQTWVCWLET